jgi:GT2 family glycosyltransferase
MFTRILAAGYCIVYQPAAVVRHRHRRSWSDLRSTVAGYGTGVYAYLIGHLLQGEIGAVRVALAWHWSQLRTIVRALVVPGVRPAASLALAELAGCAAGPIAYRRARRVAARPVVEPDRSADDASLAGTRSPCAGAARPPAAGSDALRLSVIVPTHDRRERLLHLLATLAGSAYPPERYEVIVVADGCTDGTVEALGMCVLPFPLTVACVSPGAGAAAARNRGAGMARGELLLFLDDDMEPLDGLLAEHDARHRAIEARGERGVVIGAPLPVRHGRDSFHQVAMWSWWETQFARMQAPGHRFTHEEVFSGVLSLPARLFDEVGRFDERLHCREDSELGVRLLSAGLSVEFTRSGGGWHHDLRGAPRLASRKRAEGRADVQLAERYPELWPGLRLSWPQRPWWTPMGAVRRLATVSAQRGEAFASILMALLPLLEGLRQRTWWRAAHAALVYFWYWRGVADAGAATGAQLDARALAASHASPPRELEVGVEDGLETVEQRLDALRPDTLRLTVGGRPWVTIPAVPGAEPLRGAHLRPALVRALRAAPDAVRILPLEPARGTEFLRPVAMPSVER